MDRLDVLQKLNSIRDELLDVLEALKEHEALQDVLPNSLVLATADLQRTLQAFYEFKNHVNTKVNNMDAIEEHLLRKIQETIYNTPLLRHSRRFFSEPPQKQTSFPVRLDSCPCFLDWKMGKEIISLSWISTIHIQPQKTPGHLIISVEVLLGKANVRESSLQAFKPEKTKQKRVHSLSGA